MKYIGREIKKTHFSIVRYVNFARCRKDAHTEMNRRVVAYMYERKGEDIYQKDIESHFSLCRSSASGLIDRMVDKGLIKIEKASDKRLKKLVLTSKANEYAEMFRRQMEEFESKISEGITDAELENFFAVLDKVNENLNKLTEKGEGDAHN